MKELIPYSSVYATASYFSSCAKLQTAGGLLEQFKTFLSRYFIAFLKINTHDTYSPFCRHSERASQGPFLSWRVSYSLKQDLCSDFSAAVGLNFIYVFSLFSLAVPLYQVNKRLVSHKAGEVITAQLCYHCAHRPWARRSIPARGSSQDL